MSKPAVSIVMPCLDGMPHLPNAIASIRAAFPRDKPQIIVADGGSRDGSLEYLRCQDLTLLEGPDGSLYEGLNRAIAAVRGEYVFWVNSDDVLTDSAANLLTLAVKTGAEVATGEVEISGGNSRGAWRSDNATRKMTPESVLFGVPTINSRLMATRLVHRIGAFRTDIGLGADRQFLLRLLHCRAQRVALPEVVYRYRSHPQSRTVGKTWPAYKSVHEAHTVLAETLRSNASILYDQALVKAFETRTHLAFARALLFCGDLGGGARQGLVALRREYNLLGWGKAFVCYRRFRGHGSGW